MRKILVLAVSALLMVACGSSSKSGASPQMGPMSGTIGGKAFTPKAAQAVKARATDCNTSGLPPFAADAVLIEATSAGVDPAAASSLVCVDDLGDAAVTCQYHQPGQTLAIIVANVSLDPTTVTTLTPRTFDVFESLSGLAVGGAYAEILGADPTCATTTSSIAKSGQVTITDVSGPITGSVNLTFQNGDSVTGTFSAPLCGGVNPSVCDRVGTIMGRNSLCASSCQ